MSAHHRRGRARHAGWSPLHPRQDMPAKLAKSVEYYFLVTFRTFSGEECEIPVSGRSRLYAVREKCKAALGLPSHCFIHLYDSMGCAMPDETATLEDYGIVEPCTLPVHVVGHMWIARPCSKAPVSDQDHWQHWQRTFDVSCSTLVGVACTVQFVALSVGDAFEKAYAELTRPEHGMRTVTLRGALTTLDELGIFEPSTLQVRVPCWQINDFWVYPDPLLRAFELTVQLLSGKSITILVEPEYYIVWVIALLEEAFDLRCKMWHLVHDDQRLIFHVQSQFSDRDIGIDGATTLNVVIEGDCCCKPWVYPWEMSVRPWLSPAM